MFLDHRTIRKFSTQQVDPQCLNRLITVAQHTATSHFLQSFSIIHITDSALRSQIAAISHQTYVDGNGELLIFVADQYRADLCADHPNQLSSTDKFIQAASDTLLAAENLVDAAENQGLGTVILGSILNDPKGSGANSVRDDHLTSYCSYVEGYAANNASNSSTTENPMRLNSRRVLLRIA